MRLFFSIFFVLSINHSMAFSQVNLDKDTMPRYIIENHLDQFIVIKFFDSLKSMTSIYCWIQDFQGKYVIVTNENHNTYKFIVDLQENRLRSYNYSHLSNCPGWIFKEFALLHLSSQTKKKLTSICPNAVWIEHKNDSIKDVWISIHMNRKKYSWYSGQTVCCFPSLIKAYPEIDRENLWAIKVLTYFGIKFN